jgi:hypothetical protein
MRSHPGKPASGFQEKLGRHAINFSNHVLNYHICILLIKKNPMIYICCTKHRGKAVVCVLAVRDDEHDMGGIKDASSELAEGWDTRGKALGSHMEHNRHVGTRREPAPGFRRLGTVGKSWGR